MRFIRLLPHLTGISSCSPVLPLKIPTLFLVLLNFVFFSLTLLSFFQSPLQRLHMLLSSDLHLLTEFLALGVFRLTVPFLRSFFQLLLSRHTGFCGPVHSDRMHQESDVISSITDVFKSLLLSHLMSVVTSHRPLKIVYHFKGKGISLFRREEVSLCRLRRKNDRDWVGNSSL